MHGSRTHQESPPGWYRLLARYARRIYFVHVTSRDNCKSPSHRSLYKTNVDVHHKTLFTSAANHGKAVLSERNHRLGRKLRKYLCKLGYRFLQNIPRKRRSRFRIIVPIPASIVSIRSSTSSTRDARYRSLASRSSAVRVIPTSLEAGEARGRRDNGQVESPSAV